MTYLEVNVTSPVPVYQQIMDQLRRLVSDGSLAPGAPLPSVRQLAAELAINPNTVAKAYQFLEMEGTIVTLKRRGAFVGESSSAKAALARDRRLEEVVDRLADEAARLGLNGEEIIEAFAQRVRQRDSEGGSGEGSVRGPGGESGGAVGRESGGRPGRGSGSRPGRESEEGPRSGSGGESTDEGGSR